MDNERHPGTRMHVFYATCMQCMAQLSVQWASGVRIKTNSWNEEAPVMKMAYPHCHFLESFDCEFKGIPGGALGFLIEDVVKGPILHKLQDIDGFQVDLMEVSGSLSLDTKPKQLDNEWMANLHVCQEFMNNCSVCSGAQCS